MEENYLAKWLNNELSEEELAAFKSTAEYASYRKILEVSGSLEAPDFDVEKALADFRQKQLPKEVKVIRMKPVHKIMRVAAAIAVIFVVSYLYIDSLKEMVSTQYAERGQVILPDNSEVTLNADSEVSYSKKRWDKKREVILEGEAFFKVAKGKKFTVSTDAGEVSVLGTQFNVENREGFFEVTCFEGLVSVLFKGKETQLPAGTSFMVLENKVINTTATAGGLPSWMSSESSFKSIPLSYVLDEFERQFNIKVETQNVDLEQLFTGTFSNTNINLALQSISTPSRINFELKEGKVLFYAENAP